MFYSNQLLSAHQGSKRGFSLINLMIAMAFVAIVFALAIPAYSDYRIRARITECINGATPAKFAISEYYQTYGEWPPDLAATGQADTGSSRYCTAINNYQSSTGAFTIDVNELAVNFGLVNISPHLEPTVTTGNTINWSCTAGETELDEVMYLPASCRDI